MKNEFLAGTLVLTQEALDEAPYRYESYFHEAMRLAGEKVPLQTLAGKDGCNEYKVRPLGKNFFI